MTLVALLLYQSMTEEQQHIQKLVTKFDSTGTYLIITRTGE